MTLSRSLSAPKRGTVRYAVIGLGHIAQAAVLPAFRHARRNSVLTALVSDTPRKLRTLGKRYRVEHLLSYRELDEFFSSGAVDAVYIALPNHLHKDYTLRAAAAGLHVLCEKPMAVTARDAQAMIRACRAARVKLMIAYRLHFDRANLEAAATARAGRLGELRFFSSDFSMQVSPDNVRLKRAFGGGPLYDIGIYCINAARSVLGEDSVAVWATATRSADRRFREIDETAVGALRFKGDRLASFTCSFGAGDRSTYTVTGTRGSLTLDPAYEYAQGLAYEMKIGERVRKKTFPKSDQFAPELLYFSDCILKDGAVEPSGEEGLLDVRIIEGMMRSIKTGRWIKLPPAHKHRRVSLRQARRRPAVSREPKLIGVESASQ
jgi:predicted dehydrogenase